MLKIKNFFNFLEEHPIYKLLALIALLVTVGIPAYNLLVNQGKKPVYHTSSISVITSTLTDKASELEIRYNDNPINNLTISKIGLINLGKETIERSDIPPKGKLAVEFPQGVEIYNKQILFATNTANDVCIYQVVDIVDDKLNSSQKQALLKGYQNKVYIDFEYLAYNEGTVIQIAHSGEVDHSNIIFNGVLKGIDVKEGNIYQNKRLNQWIIMILSSFLGIFLSTFGTFVYLVLNYNKKVTENDRQYKLVQHQINQFFQIEEQFSKFRNVIVNTLRDYYQELKKYHERDKEEENESKNRESLDRLEEELDRNILAQLNIFSQEQLRLQSNALEIYHTLSDNLQLKSRFIEMFKQHTDILNLYMKGFALMRELKSIVTSGILDPEYQELDENKNILSLYQKRDELYQKIDEDILSLSNRLNQSQITRSQVQDEINEDFKEIFQEIPKQYKRKIYKELKTLMLIGGTILIGWLLFNSFKKEPQNLSNYYVQFSNDWKLENINQELNSDIIEIDDKRVKIEKLCQ